MAHFPTKGISGTLVPMVWAVVKELEGSGFKVTCIVCDGAAPNWNFFKMNASREWEKYGVPYKTKNIYARDGRCIYFMSDVPYLSKTVHNCWLGSRSNGPRCMQV